MNESINNQSRRSNSSGRLNSSYKAEVVNNAHPDGLHLAQVRLLGYWDGVEDDLLPWAEYLLPLGARVNEGDIMPVQQGDLVWVDFPQMGDTRYPRITGAAYKAPKDVQLPLDAFEETYQHKRLDTEPDAPASAYGDKVIDLFGILQQITMNGDYCLTHKPSGTAIHIDQDGKLILHSEGETYHSSQGDLNIVVNGKSNIKSSDHVKMEAPTIEIGIENNEPMVLGNKLEDLLKEIIRIFNDHSHGGNLGAPVSKTFTPMVFKAIKSTTVKVQK